ncbi:hypothetical protein N0V85_003541 [Neurospora sp. IMI 360204]|nr:hypothetical protein N0V85_003541 [Neurospora sp. IMI 360204]
MCHLKYHLFICRHWSSKIKTCHLKCHQRGGIPFSPPKVKPHYYPCDSIHCWLNIRYMYHTGQINTANWTMNEDAHPNVSDSEEEEEEQVIGKDERGVIKYDPKQASREKAAAVIAWLQEYYPAYLDWLRWEEKDLEERYHFDPKMYPSPDADSMAMAIVRYQDQQAANPRYGDAWYREKLREFQAWVEWYQATPEQQRQLQWQAEQAHTQHSSLGHYLPAPNSTLYRAAPGDYDGHDGRADVSGVPGVAGLLTAPPPAGEASGSKSSSSSSSSSSSIRNKDASRHGKTEKKKERETRRIKEEREGRTKGRDNDTRR